MKLWQLYPRPAYVLGDDNPWDPWFGRSFGFVIRAGSEQRAREIADDNGGDETCHRQYEYNKYQKRNPWLDPKYSVCMELTQEGEEELILQDFSRA